MYKGYGRSDGRTNRRAGAEKNRYIVAEETATVFFCVFLFYLNIDGRTDRPHTDTQEQSSIPSFGAGVLLHV